MADFKALAAASAPRIDFTFVNYHSAVLLRP